MSPYTFRLFALALTVLCWCDIIMMLITPLQQGKKTCNDNNQIFFPQKSYQLTPNGKIARRWFSQKQHPPPASGIPRGLLCGPIIVFLDFSNVHFYGWHYSTKLRCSAVAAMEIDGSTQQGQPCCFSTSSWSPQVFCSPVKQKPA